MQEELWAIYARCSTEEQAKEGYSIEVQIDACKKIINDIPGAKLFKIYVDEGLSGSDSIEKRPNALKLLTDAKKKLFKGIAIFKADRLGRLAHEREQIIQTLIRYGIEIRAHSGEILMDNSPQGEFIRKTLANIDELEVKTLAFRIKNTLNYKAHNGEWKGGTPPYGMIWNKDKQRMDLIPECIEQIKLIYKMYVEELKGIHTIFNYLNKHGIPYFKEGKIEKWNKDRVTCILKTPLYCGYQWHNTRYGKLDIRKEGKKYKDKSEWLLLPVNFVIPIILREVWEKAQEIREQRGKKLLPTIRKTSWLLTGLMFCKICGSPMQGHPQINRRIDKNSNIREYDCSSYICQGRISKGKSYCNSKQIVKKLIENLVVEQIRDRIRSLANKDNLAILIKDIVEEYIKEEKKDCKIIEQELAQINTKIQKYYFDYENDKITADIMMPAIRRLQNEKDAIIKKQQNILDKINNFEEIEKIAIRMATSFQEWGRHFEESLKSNDTSKQKALLVQVIDKIIINSNTKEVEIQIKKNEYVYSGDAPLANHQIYIYKQNISEQAQKIVDQIIKF